MMHPLFKKLNYKDQPTVYILHAPATFKSVVEEMNALTQVKTNLASTKTVSFFLAFVTKQNEVNNLAKKIAPLIAGDATIWFAYPKGSSKKYTCEFNRDNGWTVLGQLGFEPVRMVAIDEDWSALRFRRAEHIKTMTRNFAISDAGREKVKQTAKSKRK